jgi:hypothetical protein
MNMTYIAWKITFELKGRSFQRILIYEVIKNTMYENFYFWNRLPLLHSRYSISQTYMQVGRQTILDPRRPHTACYWLEDLDL